MKKYLLCLFLLLVSYSVYSQKVTVKVIKNNEPAVSEWRILDENYRIVFSGDEYYRSDSVIFSLDASKRYFLQLSVTSITNTDTAFFTLELNDEPLLLLKTDIGTGDHFISFFTGVRVQDVKITGGTTALISEFPYQVYYISGNYVCSGSIIGNKWILTAAHCTEDDYGNRIPVSQMAIKAGMNDPSNPSDGQIYYIKNVIINEGYNNRTLLNDIAILELKDTINTPNAKPIKIVTSVDVANGATDPGVMSWVSGWGLTSVNPDVLPTSLQKVQLPLITNAQAATVWGSSITSTNLMAGYLDGNKDACSGDSGGPLVVPVFGEYKLAGIVSWGSPECNTYGAYTRVSLFEDWIRNNTDIPIQFWPPVPSGDTLVCQGTDATVYSIGTVLDATEYEWSLSPAEAGIISWKNGDAIVTWNSSFTGSASVAVRVKANGSFSEWSVLRPKVVRNTILLSQPSDTVICASQPLTLSVTAEGYDLIYRWYRDEELIQSGSSGDLVFSQATSDDSGIYTCRIDGYCGSVVTGPMSLTVYKVTNITTISPDTYVGFGNDATLNLTAEGNDLNYQWEKDGLLIDNSNADNLFIPSVNAGDIGLYRAIVTGTCGSDTSSSVYVYVKNPKVRSSDEVFLWPSVTTGNFHIAVNNDEAYTVRIYDTSGRLFLLKANCRYETTFNAAGLPRGVCIVNIKSNSINKSLKLIKE
jgi:hypothetical protein